MNSKKMALGLALGLSLVAGSAFAASCSIPKELEAGKAVANTCKTCHVFEADKPSRPTGPNLHDVYGAKVTARADYTKYSDALKEAASKGTVWDDANLMAYIADPKEFLTKVNGKDLKHGMLFKVPDEQKRKDMVAFLKFIKDKKECP